jgi:hypothetical protein
VRASAIGADGTYRIEGLAPGAYQVRACVPPVAMLQELAAGSPVDEPVVWDCRVTAGETTRFDLDLTGEGSVVLAGQLSLDGNEESGWRASLVSAAAATGFDPWRSPRAEAEVDAEGRFQLVLSRAGPYWLVLEAPMFRIEQAVELFPGRNEWSYRRETGNVRVHSTDATEKERRDWSWLRLVTADGSPAHFASSIALVQLRDCGDCRFRFPAGPARLERADNGYLPGAEWTLFRELTIVAGQELVIDYP